MISKTKLILLPLASVSIGVPIALIAHDHYKYHQILNRSIEIAKTKGGQKSEDSKIPKILVLITGDESAENEISLFKKTFSKLLTYSGIDYNLVKIDKGKSIDESTPLTTYGSISRENPAENCNLENFKSVLLWGNFNPPSITSILEKKKGVNLYNFNYNPGWFNKKTKLLEDIEGLFRFIEAVD